MAIARLKKVIILGEIQTKQTILKLLQKSSLLHLIPLMNQQENTTALNYEKLKEALSYLNTTPHKRRLQTPSKSIDSEKLIGEILLNKRQRAHTIDKIDLIKERIKDLTPWGDFEYPKLSELDGFRLWFYTVPLSKKAILDKVTLAWKILGKDHKQFYLVVVSKTEPSEQEIPFARVHVGSRSLSELNEDLADTLVELEDLNAERESLTRWIRPLTHSLDETINLARLAKASGLTLDTQDCFALSAWIPENALAELEEIRKTTPFAYILEEPKDSDNPPTLLNNNNIIGGGETAVAFFQLPGYRSWDPSLVLFFSFSVFFAIILADAGYALILGFILALKWKKLSRKVQGLRLRNLFTAIVGASIFYGILIGSYFGIKLEEGSVLAHLQVLDLNDFSSMMKLSIGIGALHLVIANAFASWKHRSSTLVLSNIGWISVISASYFLWLSYLENPLILNAEQPFVQAIIIGLLLIVLFSTKRKIRSVKDLSLKGFDGVLAFYKITKAFGDILSYMRLFALGLSSASLALTFNQLAISASESVPAGGFILFTLIILFGHLLNFILAIMSGVIHGLRLNLLEFYNWAIEGEGYPFEAFKRNEEQ
tara:strand:- start:106106 stop:107902 length:1797 start_codon:yes stop_codon:yes gene_type:complete